MPQHAKARKRGKGTSNDKGWSKREYLSTKQTMDRCKQFCLFFPRVSLGYNDGKKYCSTCNKFVKLYAVRCPCCGCNLRTRPHDKNLRDKRLTSWPNVGIADIIEHTISTIGIENTFPVMKKKIAAVKNTYVLRKCIFLQHELRLSRSNV